MSDPPPAQPKQKRIQVKVIDAETGKEEASHEFVTSEAFGFCCCCTTSAPPPTKA